MFQHGNYTTTVAFSARAGDELFEKQTIFSLYDHIQLVVPVASRDSFAPYLGCWGTDTPCV